jgi:hypothetical protein
VANVRVGVSVLKECINRAGSLAEAGLKLYVGAGNLKDDQGYAAKVLLNECPLQQVAKGVKVSMTSATRRLPPKQPQRVSKACGKKPSA